jgi:hypothetical protein
MRPILSCILSCLLSLTIVVPANAQEPRRVPPTPDDGPSRARRRAPPAPDENMPVRQAPILERFLPAAGPPGCTVTLYGENFDETTRVRFNGRWLNALSRSDRQMRVVLPGSAASDTFVISKSGFPDLSSDRVFNVIRAPVITGFAPRRGGPGTQVTIVGANFLPGDRVVLGSLALASSPIPPARIVVQIPEGAASNRLGIQRGDSVVAWSQGSFDVVGQPPLVLGFAPTRGARGTMVRITGQNFEPSDRVEMNGDHLEVRSRSAVHFDVLIGNQTSGRFAVVGREGRRAESSGTFLVIRPLTVSGFSPTFGPPGTRITVEGAGFMAGDAVHLGQAMLTVRTISDATIVAEVPAGVASGPVLVRRGGQTIYARGRFEVLLGPAITNVVPSSGPPGATVTIQGRNFLPDVNVLLAGQRLPIVRRRLPEELTVVIPPSARTGALVVLTRAGSAQSPILFTVSQYGEIASFFPLHGLPGSRVTLRGSSFHPGIRVFLGSVPLGVVEQHEGSLVVEIPEGATSGYFQLDSYGKRIASRMAFTVEEPRPEVEFSFAPTTARRGTEVSITLSEPREGVVVLFDGRPLPKKVLQGGRLLVVTVPGDAQSGYLELEHNGRRYRARHPLRVK